MKKILIVILISVPLMISSCFEERESLVNLGLGSPPADIVWIHVAVYENIIDPSNALSSTSVRPGVSASIAVSQGDNRIFVVVAEDSTGRAAWNGVSAPTSINSPNESLDVAMKELIATAGISTDLLDVYLNQTFQPRYTNESQIGADTYVVFRREWDSGDPFIEVFRGRSVALFNFGAYQHIIRPYYSLFDIYADSYSQ